MLTSEIPGTLLDLGCQFQWSLGVWYNTLYSAKVHDINAAVAKMADQKYHLQTIRKVWSFLKQNFELDSTMAIKRSDQHAFAWLLSLKLLDKILFKPHHISFNMYITMSETFIKIDSLRATPGNFKKNLAYEPAKNTRYNIHCFGVMLIFPNWCLSYIPPWLVHFSMNFIAYFECKTFKIFTLFTPKNFA